MTLKAPWNTPTSSPIRKTDSSALHLLAHGLVERLAVAHHGHQASSSCCASSAGPGAPWPSALVLRAAALLHVAGARVGGARLGQLVRDAVLADLVLVLAAVHLGRALVDRVPALHLVAEHVDVVVERLERGLGARVGELDRLVDDLDRAGGRAPRSPRSSSMPASFSSFA